MLNEFPRPMFFAHRGASSHAPENTLAAFELAVRQFKYQPPAIELDAKLSADGQVFVFHDQTLERTSNGHGKTCACTLAQLKELDAGSYFDVDFAGEKIPTLDEVFETVGKKAFINVELTNYATPRDALNEKVAEVVQRHNLDQKIMFSSFSPGNLRKMARLLPQIPRGLLALRGLAGAWARGWIGRLWVPHQALNPEIHDAVPHLVASAHRTGRRVNVYTANEAKDIQRLVQIGVDGIFTDDVLLAEQALVELNSRAT